MVRLLVPDLAAVRLRDPRSEKIKDLRPDIWKMAVVKVPRPPRDEML